jgi:Sec-independent protein translocase protein TatA
MPFGVDVIIVLVVVLVVVLIWRGPKILPKWGETLGRGVKATRKEVGELQDEIRKRDDEASPPAPPPAG